MYTKCWLLIAFPFLVCSVNGINILGIFDIPSKSLHILGHELLLGLSKRGYNVTLMSAFPLEYKNIPNYNHIYLDGLLEFKEKQLDNVIQGQSKLGMLSMINVQTYLVNMTFTSKTMKDFLNSDSKYDIIIQTYAMNEGYLGLAHHFDARVIGFVPFSSMPTTTAVTGNSAPPSYVPLPILDLPPNMNFFERVKNTVINSFIIILHQYYLFPQQEQIFRNTFPNAPPLDEIRSERVDLIFSNTHFSNESPRPNTPNIIYIGGYHVQEPEPLSPDLKQTLDNAQEGVVFFGFGTNVDIASLPKEKMDAFVNKLANIPYKVLIKYKGSLHNKPKNIETSEWYPQRGVLAHRNTKIFISHGGKGSSTESLYFGVPTLCVSFYGDQAKNCEDIVNYGYGIHVPYLEITEETFSKAFDELTGNPKYMTNAKYRAALFQEHEMDPLDRASFWIEHIYKFKGAKHLQPHSVNMPLYQYLLLDVLAFLFAVVTVSVLILFSIVKFLIRRIFTKKQRKVKVN